MKKIYLKPFYSSLYLNNNIFRINNGHNIFWNIDKKLARNGISINTIDLDKKRDGDLYLYADVPYLWQTQLWKRIITTKEKNILFNFESPLVNPFSQIKILHTFFKDIYTWNEDLLSNKKYHKFFVPQLSDGLNTNLVNFRKKKFLILVNSKKDVPFIFTMLSPYKKNLYQERIRAIEYFSKTIPNDFELYGKGWDNPLPWNIKEKLFGATDYKTYKGELKGDKIKAMAGYKFSLCFENASAPGYITEKIFDSFKAKCIPIYWGAPDVSKYIPKNCFVDFRDFNDYASLLEYLNNMSEIRYNKYIEEIDVFLKDKYTLDKWFEDGFMKLLLKILKG